MEGDGFFGVGENNGKREGVGVPASAVGSGVAMGVILKVTLGGSTDAVGVTVSIFTFLLKVRAISLALKVIGSLK